MTTSKTIKTIAVSGASGFIGSQLLPFLTKQGFEIIRLTRKPSSSPLYPERLWNPNKEQMDLKVFEGVDVVIHLAGKNLNQKRWNGEEKETIRNSRVVSTELLSKALAQLKKPPLIFLSASAIGFYGNRGDETVTESSKKGSGFLADLCQDWEASTKAAVRAGIRVVQLRTGIVISRKGGALARMIPFFKIGLGGIVGSGNQYMSWIELNDYLRAIMHIIQTPSLAGPINMVAPGAVRNKEFTHILGHLLKRPTLIFTPSIVIRLLWGEMGIALLLEGVKVLPKKLLDSGFYFHYPKLEDALKHII